MLLIRDIYNISEEEQAGIFTEALLSYFVNKSKDVYSPSLGLDYINQIISNITFYDCRSLDTSERFMRESLARYIANAYARTLCVIDWTYCSMLIAFVLRHDLSDALEFIEKQAEKLNVRSIMFQTNVTCKEDIPKILSDSKVTTFYYETTHSHKCLMELWCGTTFYDEYNRYADDDIRDIEQKYTDHIDADYYIVYFPNLNVVRVKDVSTGSVYREIPNDI